MTDIFVDPIIVAAPSAYAGADVVVEYLDKLYRWLEEALNSPHHWFYSKEIFVSAKIAASVPDFAWGDDSLFTQMLPLLFTPDDLPPPTGIITLWDEGEQGMRYAIDRWYTNDWQSSTVGPLKYRFRPSFFESITNYEIDTDTLVLMRIVRAAAAIIAEKAKDIKSYNLRQLRESKTADSKQRTRPEDNAKAWRLTITPDGVGWRMHYWHVPTAEGSGIEFANILKKHDPEEIY